MPKNIGVSIFGEVAHPCNLPTRTIWNFREKSRTGARGAIHCPHEVLPIDTIAPENVGFAIFGEVARSDNVPTRINSDFRQKSRIGARGAIHRPHEVLPIDIIAPENVGFAVFGKVARCYGIPTRINSDFREKSRTGARGAIHRPHNVLPIDTIAPKNIGDAVFGEVGCVGAVDLERRGIKLHTESRGVAVGRGVCCCSIGAAGLIPGSVGNGVGKSTAVARVWTEIQAGVGGVGKQKRIGIRDWIKGRPVGAIVGAVEPGAV